MYNWAYGDSTLLKAIEKWGAATQEQMAIGEIGELLALYGRRVQNRDDAMEWIDEIADVTIMLRQLALMTDPVLVAGAIDTKMCRLKKALEED